MNSRLFRGGVLLITALLVAAAMAQTDDDTHINSVTDLNQPAKNDTTKDELIQFKLNLQKGQKFYVKTVTEQQISRSTMNQEQIIDETRGIGTDFEVNEVDPNGNGWVCYTYRWAQFLQNGPMGQITYDSSKTDANVPPQAQGFAVLLGEGFEFKMTPVGEVLQVKGLDGIRSNIEKKLPDGTTRNLIMMSLDQYLNEQSIKQQLEQLMAVYPEKPVAVGDSWNKTVASSSGFGLISDNEWTLRDRHNGVATIEVVTSIKPNPQAKPIEMGSVKMSYELYGQQQGLIRMQESTGQILQSRIERQLTGRMKRTISGEQQQETNIPLKIKSIITTETSERNEETAK